MTELPAHIDATDSIRSTVEMYDPNGLAIVIGTAAIFWELARRDLEPKRLALKDVDVLTSQDSLESMYKALQTTDVTSASLYERRLRVEPSDAALKLGVVALDAISDSDSYDDPLVTTKSNHRIYAHDVETRLQEQIAEYKGIRYLKLPFILWWKSVIGRPSDIVTIQTTMNILYTHGTFDPGEEPELLNAYTTGIAGGVYGW